MQRLSFVLTTILATSLLGGCVSSIKPETKQLEFYDFGLASAQTRIEPKLPVDSISSSDAIQNNKIRYRLNYKNPAQIFAYAESRWSTLPLDLVRQKLGNSALPQQQCSVKLNVVAFDQVFDSPGSNKGVVQIQSTLIDRKSRHLLASSLIEASSNAPTADVKGGVTALDTASTSALQQALAWAEQTAANTANCQPASIN
ncbi:ABC-type transport auxiliary lipoprotein family protein [Methylobacillus gramineus]|uniref:ABC-type transport auxiliary lipoprotein family protein n=1 Tax=Methylobacillus gramineus TaxID=755169 RepID=UPI001CFF9BEC|nr:ABC-type transport auxiliary lipoprotein family protein [Methylobacillus gramineus]MCB5186077.1 ABC-type transport auxiliary lipoprotein family protein [Methylobacillus gramineus]